MFAQFLSKLFSSSAARPPRRPGWCTLRVEPLEDRLTPNNRFVVPVGVPVDNVTNFATLSSALTTAGLTTGNIIQIEPGAAPGNVVNANFTAAFATATVLTIRGDDAVSAPAVPLFTVSDATTIAANRTLNLNNANVGLIAAGAVIFNGNANISNSVLVDINSTAGVPFTFAGTVDNLTNSTVVNNVAVGNVLFDIATNAAGTSHLISGNTFVSNATTNVQLGWYNGSGVAVTDLLTNNTFSTSPGAATNFSVLIQESISGLVIQNNRISGPAGTGILQLSNPTNLQILNNNIDLNAATSTGIYMSNGAATTSGTVANNVIKTNGTGTGLQTDVGSGAMNLKVQGNDFHTNKVGVRVSAGASSVANVDLGGGTQGSLGGNNFRGYTAAATATTGAITTTHTTGAMQAQNNIFSVANPQTVIFKAAAGTVNTTGQLTGNAAFVQSLYNQFLRRTGDVNNPNDAGAWVNFMTAGGTQAQVANGIIRSPEALGYVVDDLYRTILGREADPVGRAFHVNLMVNGWTIETVQIGLYGGAEYRVRFPGDAAFITSLYWSVLGRNPLGGVAPWLDLIPSVGRGGVAAGFVLSTEYRTTQVTKVFFDVLKRTQATAPTAPQVAAWVDSGADLLSLRVAFASSPEFFVAG
jgi:hypothetical protein